MRKTVTRLAGAIGVAALLSACGSTGYSFNEGYTVGQSVAANGVGGSMDQHEASLACNHEWRLSAPAGSTKHDWLKGCLTGYRAVARSVHS